MIVVVVVVIVAIIATVDSVLRYCGMQYQVSTLIDDDQQSIKLD